MTTSSCTAHHVNWDEQRRDYCLECRDKAISTIPDLLKLLAVTVAFAVSGWIGLYVSLTR